MRCIGETYLSYLQNNSTSDDLTFIAVVRKPMYGIQKVTDEHMPELSPPEELLNDFWEEKEENTHNEAWDKVNFEKRYRKHIMENIEHVENIVDRLEQEDIILVCFEKKPKNCHRHILKEFIIENYDGIGTKEV